MPLTPLVISANTNNNSSTSPNLPPSSSNSSIPSASVLISASNSQTGRRNTTNNNTYGSASATVIGVGRSLQSRGGKQNVMIPLGTMGNTPTTVHNYQTPRKDDPIINNNSNIENSPITSNHSNSHSKEYEQVNQVFDGLSSSIHQLYHQLKQTQESIRKISESQPSSLNNSFNTSSGTESILDPISYTSPSVGRYHNQYNASMEEPMETSTIIRNDDSIVLSDADEIISLDNTLGTTTTTTNTISSVNTGSMLNLEPFLHQTVSTSMLQDSSVFHELKSELDFKNEENITLKMRIEQLTNLISTLEERANSSINLIEPVKPANYIPKSDSSSEQVKQLKEQLAIQQEINRMQSSKIENYESAIQIILSRSHEKIQDITQENSRMTGLLQQENGTLQAINSKLLLQNTILKSKLLEMIQVMRDAARERDLELINYESLLNANIKERDVLAELLNIGKQYGNIE